MAWAIECSLIAEFDLTECETHNRTEIELTKQNLIELISTYNFLSVDSE